MESHGTHHGKTSGTPWKFRGNSRGTLRYVMGFRSREIPRELLGLLTVCRVFPWDVPRVAMTCTLWDPMGYPRNLNHSKECGSLPVARRPISCLMLPLLCNTTARFTARLDLILPELLGDLFSRMLVLESSCFCGDR